MAPVQHMEQNFRAWGLQNDMGRLIVEGRGSGLPKPTQLPKGMSPLPSPALGIASLPAAPVTCDARCPLDEQPSKVGQDDAFIFKGFEIRGTFPTRRMHLDTHNMW